MGGKRPRQSHGVSVLPDDAGVKSRGVVYEVDPSSGVSLGGDGDLLGLGG
jgi:hypothetical protein